jgi:hypothetical protein
LPHLIRARLDGSYRDVGTDVCGCSSSGDARFAWPSSLSQLGVFLSVGVVVVHSATSDFGSDNDNSNSISGTSERGEICMWGQDPLSLITALPLICFGFQCHLTCEYSETVRR